MKLRLSVGIFRATILSVIFAVSSFASFGETLSEYHQKVTDAKNFLGSCETELPLGKTTEIAFREIRSSFLKVETVESNGVTTTVDNKWLEANLKEFAETDDVDRRDEILSESVERLSALENRLTDLETATAGSQSKDQNKQKMSEILRRVEFQKPEVKETAMQRFFRQMREEFEKFWNWLFPESKIERLPQTQADGQSLSNLFIVILTVIALGLLGLIVWKLLPFFAREAKRSKKKDEVRIILGEKLEPNQTAADILEEANRLALAGNLRAAIRKGYIALLCELSDKKIIGLARHKTNRDYLRDVRNRKEIYPEMNLLTNNFERTWYGFGEATDEDWNEFQTKCRVVISSQR